MRPRPPAGRLDIKGRASVGFARLARQIHSQPSLYVMLTKITEPGRRIGDSALFGESGINMKMNSPA